MTRLGRICLAIAVLFAAVAVQRLTLPDAAQACSCRRTAPEDMAIVGILVLIVLSAVVASARRRGDEPTA